MDELRFTIVIPTKNRADTLYWALKTCVEQDYQNLEIIVSDNFSADNTKEVTEAFHDHRIRYINTNAALSMSGNWEFALSHVTSGYVTFLGDDDALLPAAIQTVNKIANEGKYDAINAACIEYNWPNHVNPLERNRMFFPENNLEEIPDVIKLLHSVLLCKSPYSTLPWLYKGFVSMSLINKIKEKSPAFFKSRNPDIYSAIAISSVIKNGKYFYSPNPFAINGASSHSNGVSQSAKNKNAGALEFISDLSLPFHQDLVICNSFPVYVYECYLQAKEAGLFEYQNPDIVELDEILDRAMEMQQFTSKKNYQQLKESIREIGKRNHVDEIKLSEILKRYPNKKIFARVAKKAKSRYFSNVHLLNVSDYNVKNVYDAAHVADKILKKEIKFYSGRALKAMADDVKTLFKKRP